MSTAYLDPGSAKDHAVAFFEGLTLTALAWQSQSTQLKIVSGGATQPTSLLWEKPQVYPKSKGNPNQIVDLAIAGALAADYWARSGAVVTSVAPRDWKGTIAKPVHHMRLWLILTPAEQALFPVGTWEYIEKSAYAIAMGKEPAYTASVVDLLDAAALGCYALGRLPGPIAGKVKKRAFRRRRKVQYNGR